MTIHQRNEQNLVYYAFLPFVELSQESVIQFGPVVFWHASKYESFIPNDFQKKFDDYLHSIGQIIPPKSGTCISLRAEVPIEMREFLLVDALYLLYFAGTFRNLYYGQEIPSFNAFRKVIPAHEDFIKNKQNWNGLSIKEVDREEIVCLHPVDVEISEGLGKALKSIYISRNDESKEVIQAYKRLVRSIRYLVDRFFKRFVNLFGKGLSFPNEIFEPEDVIFLTTSFESLFNLDGTQSTAAEFKHKLRPLLHLKYNRPVEVFWKWVDNFYELKRQVLNGNTVLHPIFRYNPNFEISHILLGIKLFVYSVYYYLYNYQLIKSTHSDPYTPPDFKRIHPQEILIFFWTEDAVLEKIHSLINQIELKDGNGEATADLNFLTTLFVSLYDRYYLAKHGEVDGVLRFIPSSTIELKKVGLPVLEKLKQVKEKKSADLIAKSIHPYFLEALEDRLEEKKLGKMK